MVPELSERFQICYNNYSVNVVVEFSKFTAFDSQTIDTILYHVIFVSIRREGKTCNCYLHLRLTKYAE